MVKRDIASNQVDKANPLVMSGLFSEYRWVASLFQSTGRR